MTISSFESRKGKPQCTPGELYDFVTDLRHFRQFVPEGKVESLTLDRESCTFSVPAIGEVNVKLAEKTPVRRVVYTGNALADNEFTLKLEISGTDTGNAEVRVFLDAEMNPFLKMMASGPIARFLETLVDEIEKFKGWNPGQ